MTDKKKLKITIFDREYSLLVENQEIATELANYVNNAMEETREEMPDQRTLYTWFNLGSGQPIIRPSIHPSIHGTCDGWRLFE